MTQAELIILTKRLATTAGMDPILACAMVEQESAWHPYAIRPESESGFAARYGAAYQTIVRNSATKVDDRWLRFEDVFYCSYGLLQTMYPVIIETFPEQASLLKYPTDLCDPEIGLTQGIRLYLHKLKRANNNQRIALLRWNGGGNPAYPDEVLSRAVRYS